MSTHAVTYWEIHCDEPGCDIKTVDLGGDYSAWGDPGAADDEWFNSDGQVLYGENLHYCCKHRKPQCAECDNTKDLETDNDGDTYCPSCLEYERNRK